MQARHAAPAAKHADGDGDHGVDARSERGEKARGEGKDEGADGPAAGRVGEGFRVGRAWGQQGNQDEGGEPATGNLGSGDRHGRTAYW